MQTFFECLPCLVRQAVDASERATSDPHLRESILRDVLAAMSAMDLLQPPPAMAERIQQIVREHTGVDDPYAPDKARSNALAAHLVPSLRERIAAAEDPFEAALRMAVAGNIIDFGVHGTIADETILDAVESAFEAPLDRQAVAALKAQARQARRILYLADNAGELYFDRLFIEALPRGRVTVAVKAGPILNDATRDDALAAGIDAVAAIVDNGTRIPGTLLTRASESFRALLRDSDLIISKGQGNFETYTPDGTSTFFLFKVKCAMVAAQVHADIGTLMVYRVPSRQSRAQAAS